MSLLRFVLFALYCAFSTQAVAQLYPSRAARMVVPFPAGCVLQQPEVRRTLEAATIDIIGNTPAEFARYIESEHRKWAGVVKASGVRVE